jgi:endonuclease/exonuclease/phosphatase (EEP) superfamily protein YafD
MRLLAPLSAVLAAAAVLAVVAQALTGAQTGPLPLAGVFELHLLVVAAVLALVALLGSLGPGRRRAWTRLAMLAVIVVAVIRAGGELWSPGPAEAEAGTTTLTVLSWNLEMESRQAADTAAGVAQIDADIVALQELTPAFAEAIEAEPTLRGRYPYRILHPQQGPAGLGILAKRPLLVRATDAGSRTLGAGLLLADGRTIEILNVHPPRPLYDLWGPLPVSLDTRARDEGVARIAALVAALDDPDAALVVGDLNGTSSEVGLRVLQPGLANAHEVTGTGPGFTWRPDQLETLDTGVLRIDHVLAGAWLTPVASDVDCTQAGDHCRLTVMLRLLPAPEP